jgi:hypothetical protein
MRSANKIKRSMETRVMLALTATDLLANYRMR